MPTYTYKCDKCGQIFDRMSSISSRDEPKKCECGGNGHKSVTAPVMVHGGYYDNITRKRTPI